MHKRFSTDISRIPINACWKPGPAKGNDPLEKDLISNGERFLVLIRCINEKDLDFWDAHVIEVTEDGWDDEKWKNASWYMELTNDNMPQIQ